MIAGFLNHQQYGSEFLSDIHHDGIFTYQRWLSGGTLTVTWHLETSRRTAGNITRCNKNSAVWWREVGRCSCSKQKKWCTLVFEILLKKQAHFLVSFFRFTKLVKQWCFDMFWHASKQCWKRWSRFFEPILLNGSWSTLFGRGPVVGRPPLGGVWKSFRRLLVKMLINSWNKWNSYKGFGNENAGQEIVWSFF